MLQIVYPTRGRGAWPSSGAGGTLSGDGTRPGAYYRAPVGGPPMPGTAGYRAVRDEGTVSIDEYAVHQAVMGIQRFVGVSVADGLYGPRTAAAVAGWQQAHGLTGDGVFGPRTAAVAALPAVTRTCQQLKPGNEVLPRLVKGHLNYESRWDVGAVGGLSPRDLGLAQINGPAHPSLSVNDRLDPEVAIEWAAGFVLGNLDAMGWDVEDAAAAYNLGRAGARAWVSAGRPQFWNGRDIWRYVANVLGG